MGWVVRLLRAEPQARRFFLAYGQSALGTGVAYVALLLIAYQRFHSPWAIALVLLADYVPPMLLSPLFGAAADRWSRRNCAVIADTARAVAYIGIALVHGIGPTVAFAFLAGTGTALFKPSIMAGLPSLVQRTRLSQATALYGAAGHALLRRAQRAGRRAADGAGLAPARGARRDRGGHAHSHGARGDPLHQRDDLHRRLHQRVGADPREPARRRARGLRDPRHRGGHRHRARLDRGQGRGRSGEAAAALSVRDHAVRRGPARRQRVARALGRDHRLRLRR